MAERNTRTLMGLVAAAAMVMALPAAAQETQQADTSAAQDTASMGRAQAETAGGQDTTQWGHEANRDPSVQNPPGYRGMERPVNVFPPDSAADTTSAGRAEDRATGTYDDPAWNDTTGAQQNPPGYRGMERPAGRDTASAGQQGAGTQLTEQQEIDRYKQRLGELGYKVEKMSKSEKKAWDKRERSGSREESQRQGGADRQNQAGTGTDTTHVGETTPKVPEDSARRLPAERGDTTGQSGGAAGEDTQR